MHCSDAIVPRLYDIIVPLRVSKAIKVPAVSILFYAYRVVFYSPRPCCIAFPSLWMLHSAHPVSSYPTSIVMAVHDSVSDIVDTHHHSQLVERCLYWQKNIPLFGPYSMLCHIQTNHNILRVTLFFN